MSLSSLFYMGLKSQFSLFGWAIPLRVIAAELVYEIYCLKGFVLNILETNFFHLNLDVCDLKLWSPCPVLLF